MGSQTFNLTGGWQKFVVPAKVKSINVTALGAGSSTQRGGTGHGVLTVTPGDELWIAVGGHGHVHSGAQGGRGGWPNGGDGGDAHNAQGGDGGAGGTVIRRGSNTGPVMLCIAGAGGTSGDGGDGGLGGDLTGQPGARGNISGAPNDAGFATGGNQNQGGNGGVTSAGPNFKGANASDNEFGQAGDGGTPAAGKRGSGGGGGGGGFRSGGGGQASHYQDTPGSGGGSGSNHRGSGFAGSSQVGGGNLSDATVQLDWVDPGTGGDAAPNSPSIVHPKDGAHVDGNSVELVATLTDTDSKQLRMVVWLATDSSYTRKRILYSDYITYHPHLPKQNKPARLTLDNLKGSTHYYVRVYAQDDAGAESANYASTNFFTNFPPTAPTLTVPAENAQVDTIDTTTFTWQHHDPDNQPQGAARLQYKRQTLGGTAQKWVEHDVQGRVEQYQVEPLTFKPGHLYVWRVKTQDPSGSWGPWSDVSSFWVIGAALTPDRLTPDNDKHVKANNGQTLHWRFRSLVNTDRQVKADIRWRVAGQGTADWISRFLNTTENQFTAQAGIFQPGERYEWQVRTYAQSGGGSPLPSDWSDSAFFRAIETPGSDVQTFPAGGDFQGRLGYGHHRVFLMAQGGKGVIGELTPFTEVSYTRSRDAVSTCSVTVDMAKASRSACTLLAMARSWIHELVVFRQTDDGHISRVWEGPITRISYPPDKVTIQAHDVAVWLSRRALRQGFDDSYPAVNTATQRAAELVTDAFARHDPNVLRYLTVYEFETDPQETMIRPDYSATAFDVLDEMASKHGIDYTVVGRRIIINDTHRPVGRLPVLRATDFNKAPTITESGLMAATQAIVTNGRGDYGIAGIKGDPFGGPLEMIFTTYSQHRAGPQKQRTAKSQAKFQESLDDQARRDLAHRFPTPLRVHLPAGAALRPDAPIPLDFLVPGMWAPLQATHTCREVTQWQKLHDVKVTESGGVETVAVTFATAPNGGRDPGTVSTSEETTDGDVSAYVASPPHVAPPPHDGGGGGGGCTNNDTFACATALTPASTTLSQSTVGFTTETGELTPGSITATAWFKWTPPSDFNFAVAATFSTAGSSFDTVLAGYKAGSPDTLANLVLQSYDDDFGGPTSQVSFGISPGDVVYLQAGGFGGATGDLVLNYPAAG